MILETMHVIVNYCMYVPVSITARSKVTKVIQLKFNLPLLNWAPYRLGVEVRSLLIYFVIPAKTQSNHYHPLTISFQSL